MSKKNYFSFIFLLYSIIFVILILQILFNKNDIKLSNRKQDKLNKNIVIENIGGAYKPDIVEPPIQYFDYIVNKGESLFSISKKINIDEMTIMKLNDIKVASIVRADNNILLSSVDGVVLKINNYNDLVNISKKYKLEIEKIIYANNLENKNLAERKIILSGVKYDPIEKSITMGVYFRRPAYGRITSYFGFRRDPWSGIRSFHTGVDIANDIGTNVFSASYGIVIDVSWSWIFGNTITISHSSGYTTYYAHLDKVFVKVGDYVSNQTVIGKIGNTGRTTGSHLHYEVRRYGKLINPFSVTLFR